MNYKGEKSNKIEIVCVGRDGVYTRMLSVATSAGEVKD